MTDFNYLTDNPQFAEFASVAVAAAKNLEIDPAACALNCRRAMECAVKWMYEADTSLVKPWQETLVDLTGTEEFRARVGSELHTRMDYIRRVGNNAAHSGKSVSRDEAELCLENLDRFLDFVSCTYGTVKKAYVPKPLEISEYKTRKLYIDTALAGAGWRHGKDWIDEYEIPGMPNKSGVGYADYILLGDDGLVLAVIEAKRTCADVSKGRQQAKLYADLIEQKQGRRPVVFLTNGFETRIIDGRYPERPCAEFYSKRDLEKLFNLRRMRTSLKHATVDRAIAGRYYQEGAIKAVCDGFDEKNRRKALLVMATGSGKTRTVIALCKILLERGWVKNILFLADRNSLVTQAKRSFVNLLPDLSVTNLCEEKDNYDAHCVFSTYQTMINCIDDVRDDEGRLFTCGHFDLLICDEAHRSIYNKYRDIFTYFDAPLVGLTATPKDEIDKNTYEIFELQNGVPTYGYELAQAVKDGFLVDFMSVETKLKFLTEGIVYDNLSPEDKEAYENTFKDESDNLPDSIAPSALNAWLFNEDTIREALNVLMTHGLKINYGNTIGKSIIFAKNHRHAEKILEIFNREYPHLPDHAAVIDNYINYAQSALDEFSDPKKLPQIAISVDMLDTGIDIPEVLNLVFFKKVMSKAKFWQMIGRGTRLCPGLLDGNDKDKFLIFDFCGNFEFFRMGQGKPTTAMMALQSAIFNLQFQIVFKLQDLQFQTLFLTDFRKSLVEQMAAKVQVLSRDNFAVRQHLESVERFSNPENYNALTYEDTLLVRDELAPLILPEQTDPAALRFDALMYSLELAYLAGKKHTRARKDLMKRVAALANIANIPEIIMQAGIIDKLLSTDYLEHADMTDLDEIHAKLRDLMKYITSASVVYTTNFDEEILSTEWNDSDLDNDDMQGYRFKAEYYVRQHPDNPAIVKLKSNIPLTKADVRELEKILWSELGSREEYETEYGQKPLGEFVREIVGLDMAAAKAAFADFLATSNLDSRQIHFVNQIVEYIVRNGVLNDLSVLRETPFTDQGSIVEVFSDLNVWSQIRKIIDGINANVLVA